MATQVNRQVNIFIQSGEAEKAYDRLIKKEQQLTQELSRATDPKQIARLQNELKKLEEPIDRASRKMKGELAPSLRETAAVMKRLDQELKQLSKEDPNFAKKLLQLRQARAEYQQQLKVVQNLQATQNNLFGKLAGGFKSFIQGIGIGFGVEIFSQAAGLIRGFFESSLEEAANAKREINNLKQTLAASGDEDVFDRVIAKGNEMADAFRFLDNDDVTGVFSKLITYGKLTENQINQLIPVIIDFYSKQQLAGNSSFTLAQASEVVIKALEGNARSLKEYGINIKEGGDLTERFGIIVNDLGSKVKGAGEAFGEDLHGQLAIAQQDIKNLQEDIGSNLLPLWENLKIGALQGIKGIIEYFQALRREFDDLFSSAAEVAARRNQEAEDEFQNRTKEFAASFVKDAATKPLKEQQRILEQQKSLLKANMDSFRQMEVLGTQFTRQGLDLNKKILQDQAVVDALQESINIQKSTRILGTGNNGGGANKELMSFLDDVKQKGKELALSYSDEFTKAMSKINDFYDNWVKKARDFGVDVQQVEMLRGQEIAILIDKEIDRFDKAEQKRQARNKERNRQATQSLEESRLNQLNDFVRRLTDGVAKQSQSDVGELQAAAELRVLLASGKKKTAAKIEQLRLEEAIEIKSAEGKENKIRLIQEKFRKKRIEVLQSETELLQQQLQLALDFAGQAAGILATFDQAKTQKENAELERDRLLNDRKKENYKRLLDSNLISAKEYSSKLSELDKAQEKREREIKLRQFKRDQRAQITQALMNGAQAVVSTLAARPGSLDIISLGTFRALNIAFAIATTAAQVLTIAKQKPSFGKGGYLRSGPLHSDPEKGLHVVNPRTNSVEAYVERDEVILSRNTVRNNKALVDRLLYSSLYQNGAPIRPAWRNSTPSYINIPVISRAIDSKRSYETGGTFESTRQPTVDLSPALDRLSSLLARLEERGITAYTILSDQERQKSRKDAIVRDATMTM